MMECTNGVLKYLVLTQLMIEKKIRKLMRNRVNENQKMSN